MVFALAGDSTITSLPDLRRGAASAAAVLAVLAAAFFTGLVRLALRAAVFLRAVFLATARFLILGSGSGRVMPSCAGVAPMRNRVVPHTGHTPCVAGCADFVKIA